MCFPKMKGGKSESGEKAAYQIRATARLRGQRLDLCTFYPGRRSRTRLPRATIVRPFRAFSQSLAGSAVNELALIPAWTRSPPLARSRCDFRLRQIPFAVSQTAQVSPRRRRSRRTIFAIRMFSCGRQRISSSTKSGVIAAALQDAKRATEIFQVRYLNM